MFVLSRQFATQSSVAWTDASHDAGEESHDRKHRLDFERFSVLPRDMFSFFSRVSDE